MTHGLRKKLLPTLKSRRRTGDRLADGIEKAFWSDLMTVVLPPDSASPGSACSKRGGFSSQAVRAKASSSATTGKKNGRIGSPRPLKGR